jgi:uroporphyrinogen-III synthase
MRLLVTRPEPEAHDTAARLEQAGHHVLRQPLTRIAFNQPPEAAAAPAAIVFTSRNAIRAVERWPQAAGWRGLPVFAVGAATAEEARRAGYGDIRAGEGDGARLARLIVGAFGPGRGPVLYPAARERTDDLAGALHAAGIALTIVEAYRAIAAERLDPAVREALDTEALDGALFYSRRSADIFADLAARESLSERLARLTMFALSARVAEPLGRLATAGIRVAARPDEAALLALIPASKSGWPAGDSPSIKAGEA